MLARRLKVPATAFDSFPLLGYCRRPTILIDDQPFTERYWTCPETDADGQPVGIERRYPKEDLEPGETDKRAWPGGSRGLNLPLGWKQRPGPAINLEGFSGAVAATVANLCATSRPGACAGIDHLVDLYRDWPRDRDIIIVGDNDQKSNGDWPGKDGAVSIATQLAEKLKRPVKWALPPDGYKDTREFLCDSEAWGDTSWIERGAQFLVHLDGTATAIGEESAQALAPATERPPQPCAHTAAADILEMLTPTCRCPNPLYVVGKRQSTGRRGFAPFGCHRDGCVSCGRYKRHEFFDSTQSFLLRLTQPTAKTEAMTVYAAIIPHARHEAVKDFARDKEGKYLIIPTTDPEACSLSLNPERL